MGNKDISEVKNSLSIPGELRGAVHELTRHYSPQAIVEALMGELPEQVKGDVAAKVTQIQGAPAEMPKPVHRPRYQYVLRTTGEVLHEQTGKRCMAPEHLRVTHADGSSTLYALDRPLITATEHDLQPDGSVIVRTFYAPAPTAGLVEELIRQKRDARDE